MLDRAQDSVKPVQGKGTVALTCRNAEMKAEANMTLTTTMTWTTPVITEICIGMEVTSYLSAEI